MAPISKEIQKQVSDKISKQITKILASPDLKQLNDDQLEKLAKSIIIDNLKEQLKTEVKKATIDIEKLKERWISTFNSNITRKNYKHNVEEFLKWLKDKSIIEIKATDADDYLRYLNNSGLEAGTIRFRIAATSSFCNYLRRAEVIQNNFFLKINGLPKIKESLKVIPSDNDIEVIEKELSDELNATGRGSAGKQRSARIMTAAFCIIKNHALRVGALQSLAINKDGKYIADSKADTVRGTLNPDCIATIRDLQLNLKTPFKEYQTTSIKKQFERFMTRLFKNKKIDHIFSCHDFRHYAAVSFYKRTLDIFATMKFLNHKNISTTQIYLKGLGINN